MKTPQPEPPVRGRELLRVIGYGVVLVWVNAYVCRELFLRFTPKMNSMQGFWMAMARLGGSWFHSQWWPYWDCGAPTEFVYAPLVPALASVMAAVRGVPHDLAFETVSGLIYCLTPLTLFLMAWFLTRAPGYAFAAGVLYTLTALSQPLVPDGPFSLQHLLDARRFYLTVVWDETPHMMALAILPLMVIFFSLSIRKRRPVYYAITSLAIAAAALASDFGPVLAAMACLCLLAVLRREDLAVNLLVTAAIAVVAYAICAPFLSPANISAIHAAAANGPGGEWSARSFTALAMVAMGWAVLWHYLQRWTADWRLQFFALFAWLTGSVPLIAKYLDREFLPQPGRYAVEMEFSLALLIVFALRPLFARIPSPIRFCLLFLLVALSAEQVTTQRRFAKAILAPTDVKQTIEYRASVWARDHLPGVRMMMPGSIGRWTDEFTDIHQVGGGSWSVAYNQVQQRALQGVFNGGDTPEQDARVSLAWLKAFGAGAIAVPGPQSQEFWKEFRYPKKFDGRLPTLWSVDDVTIYRVPQPTDSLAHVVPESALVKRRPAGPRDTAEVERYATTLDDSSLPAATFRWEGRNRIHIQTALLRGQVVSIQVTHHPGWHALVNGAARPLRRDGLGLMWIKPECNGSCDIELVYNGGAELWICHLSSLIAFAAVTIFLGWKAVAHLKSVHLG